MATNGRTGSPPRRDDDREGHYVYNLGENLTPRCKLQFLCFFVKVGFFSVVLVKVRILDHGFCVNCLADKILNKMGEG